MFVVSSLRGLLRNFNFSSNTLVCAASLWIFEFSGSSALCSPKSRPCFVWEQSQKIQWCLFMTTAAFLSSWLTGGPWESLLRFCFNVETPECEWVQSDIPRMQTEAWHRVRGSFCLISKRRSREITNYSSDRNKWGFSCWIGWSPGCWPRERWF